MTHAFCNQCLKSARADCVENNIRLGRLTTMRFSMAHRSQYEIWHNGQQKGWISADCAADAKFKYLCGLLTKLRELEAT